MCNCFDNKGNIIFCFAIQIYKLPTFIPTIFLHSAQLLTEAIKQTDEIPKVRILLILSHDCDSSLLESVTETLSSDFLTVTFKQLPKILQEGTNQKWLQILSTGATPKDLVQIDASKFN